MPLTLTDEQRSLAAAVRDWGRSRQGFALARDRPHHPRGTRAGLQAAAGLGLLGLLEPGAGGTQSDLVVVVEALGAFALAAPVGATALVVAALHTAGLAPGPGAGLDIAAVVGGATVVLPAIAEPEDVAPLARSAPGGTVVLTGAVTAVAGASDADGFLIVADSADDPDAVVLALVPADAPGLRVRERVVLDISRNFGAIALDDVRVPADRWVTGETAVDTAGLLIDAAATHAAADAVGAAAELAIRTVAYVKEREQFGQPVGKFQAVKHHCATMTMEVDAASAAVRAAALALDGTDGAERGRRVSVAASYAGEACSRAAGTALQLHGGMGFTWEHDLHVLLRRIKTDELLSGTPRWHRRRLAALLS